MDGVKEALLEPNVLVAWITAVVGPIAATLVAWATTRRRAEKAARKGDNAPASPDGEKSITEEVVGFARELRKDVAGLRAEVHKLRDLVYQLEDENDSLARRVSSLERENAILVRHNKLLTKQVVDLGGTPHPRPE